MGLHITVVCAWPDRQYVRSLEVPVGTTAAQALEASGLVTLLQADGHRIPVDLGVYGHRILDPHSHQLEDGDRLEWYRPLSIDPMQIRRLRAARHPVGRRRARQPAAGQR